ncbi:hypothetical protein WICPIJ_009463 [Wickerhamomyces pijperi]|uniref:Cleavage/polyadenylation specificity factor A subunit C-terminal domain-containing protein n=1 Tax=Wickerhamomyces pijperi TaxID=599730 RepID=A0A9P8PNL3_WICPI|nr:hypothetical protein WICPIJ_009463 [Wickerhamomyces pijperi]
MEVYDQFIDPTQVTHSLGANFYSLDRKDLIVVKNTLLQVFQINEQDKLIFVNEFKLNGKVLGIQSITNSKISNNYDSLIILTKFAKLSIVSYDHAKNTIESKSLHYYDKAILEKLTSPEIDNSMPPQLKKDPNNSLSLVHYKDILAFLPFITDEDDDDLNMDDAEDSNAKDPEAEEAEFEEFFGDSVILPSVKLEAHIKNILDCDFLYNYRDPTLGILYLNDYTWAGDIQHKKDTVNFTVISLDLKTGSSTSIINVQNLPYDTYRIKPLPSPLNGVLLIGCNQIIHIDNNGNHKGIGVNAYYKSTTGMKLSDQSSLGLFLEYSELVMLDKTNILIIDQNGKLVVLNFKLSGKTIKGISLAEFAEFQLTDKLVQCKGFAALDDDLFFIASNSSDSVLLKKFDLKSSTSTSKPEAPEAKKVKFADEDDDEDDLYDDVNDEVAEDQDTPTFGLKVVDNLINHGPITSATLGRLSPSSSIQGLPNPNCKDVSIIATTGEAQSSAIACFKPSIQPTIHSTLRFNNIDKSWNILDKYLVTTDSQNYKSEIFLINNNFKNFSSLDFKNNNVTINIDSISHKKRIIQITTTNVYLFDTNFKRSFQMNFDFEVLNAKILDPYVIITTSKGEIKIFEIDAGGKKLNKVKIPKIINDIILNFGTICKTGLLSSFENSGKRKLDDQSAEELVFLVTTINNQILAFERNHNEKVYQFTGLNKLVELASIEPFENPQGLIPDPFIKEIEFTKLGDGTCSEEVLTILTIGGELILYKLFQDPINCVPKLQKLEYLNCVTGAPENSYQESTIIERKLIKLSLNGVNLLFVSGKQPYFIIKTAKSNPKIFKFTSKSAISICKMIEEGKERFMYIDESKNARVCSLPDYDDYSNNLPVFKFRAIGETLNCVTFNETNNLLVVSSLIKHSYQAIDENGQLIPGSIEDLPKAHNFKSKVYLINPVNWVIIDTIELEENEVVNDLKSSFLTISSRSKRQREFLIVGIGKYRLEDLTVYGVFKLIDIISIVPDPSKPEIKFKFKEISNELMKGAVTKISEISGRFLVSQGQKVLIRDLQQDNSTVPVAFYDIATNVSEVKTFGNLLIVADHLKSLAFFGFDAEPYRLLLLGKDSQNMNVLSADFIIENGDVYFLVSDDKENLRLLTYQPDDPNSLQGQKLIHKSLFNNNTLTNAIIRFAKHEEFNSGNHLKSFQNIGVNLDGSIYKIVPVNESTYRRLYILQQQLSEKYQHYCGLSPRSNRYQDNEVGFKPILELGLIRSAFLNLNVEKRLTLSGKVGKDAYLEIYRDFIEVENSLKNLTY